MMPPSIECELRRRIMVLEKEIRELRQELARTTTLMVDGVLARDRAMLELIIQGNLRAK